MKRFSLLLLAVIVCITASAERITEQQALQKAQEFMPNKELKMANPLLVRQKDPKTTMSDVGYYVFNAEGNGGFVIIAGNDNIPEILGYSNTGYLNPETAPDNVKWLLELYSYASGVKSTVSYKARSRTRSSKAVISPLISTTWDQGIPYNSACPQISGNNCLTGCVATALAQVINYNRWPEGMTSSVPEYITQRNQLHLPALEPTSFNWSDMAASDIARLMLYCGQAVKMDYGLDASGAIPNEEVTALRRVFSYSRTTRFVYRNKYKDADWEELLYTELSEKRPVIYNGYTEDNKEGHTFIVHGYEDGKFYINWGWGGHADGYFQLTNLNTEVGAYNFSQCATIGIQPNTNDPVETANVEVTYFSASEDRYFTYDESGRIYFWVSGNIMRVSNEDNTYQVGVGLYDADNKLIKVLWEGQQKFTSNDNYWFSENVSIDKELEQGSYSILLISRSGESENWEPDRGSYEYYGELTVMDNVVKLRAFPLNEDEEKTVDIGVKTIDGITYDLYSIRGKNKALVLPSQEGKYKGDLYLPDNVSYEGQDYKLFKAINYSISGSPELTSLSTSMYYFPAVYGCDAVSKYDIREGVVRVNDVIISSLIDNIEFPKSINYTGGGGVGWSRNVKSIRFNSISRITMSSYPIWDTGSMPSLTDVYFMSDNPPLIEWKDGNFIVNENVTIHIPKGSLSNWKQSDWKDWKFVEDQESTFAGIELGYNNSDELDGDVVPFDLGDNDAEYAIRLPSEMLKNYIGNSISGMRFNTCYWGYDYMFITTKDKDYVVKQPLDINVRNWDWNTVQLEEPFEITGEELYIGLGHYNSITTRFSTADKPNPDGFYMRAMGSGSGVHQSLLGNFVNMTADFGGPLPLRVIVTGDKIPADLELSEVKVSVEDKLVMTAKVYNKSSKDIKKYTLRFSIDGKDSFDKVIETDLHAGKSEKISVELSDGLEGHHHSVEYLVADIDGETDTNTDNSSGNVSFVIPAKTHFPRRIVMEEGTGTWCGYCVAGIETIERLKKDYPDNFIAIALHNGDEMSGPENYRPIENLFTGYPSSVINRLSIQYPAYPDLIPIIEKDKDNADAKISASATYALKDSSSIIVTTKTVFGYSDPNMPEYRIAYVVVEDKVGPYVQNNNYSGSALDETDYMYEWSQKAGRVKMEYNDVARGIYGSSNGVKGSVPSAVKEGEEYEYLYNVKLPKNIQDKKNIRIITLLINNESGEIINADQTSVLYDKSLENQTFGFYYNNEPVADMATITLLVEKETTDSEDYVCRTNSKKHPLRGLILKSIDGKIKQVSATLEILEKEVEAKTLQWSMDGSTRNISDNKQNISFTTDNNGISQVLFEASGIKGEGTIYAKITATIGNETHIVNVAFVSKKSEIGDVNELNSQIWWSNYDESSGGLWHIVQNAPTTCSFAIHVNDTKDFGMDGATVAAASIFMPGNDFSNMKVWISKTLPAYGEVGDLESVEVPKEKIAINDFTAVPFSKEYEIGEGGLYVGYTYDYDENREGFSTAGAIPFSDSNYREGALWAQISKEDGWLQYSQQLKMKLLLGGDVFEYDAASPISFRDKLYYSVIGGKEAAKLTIRNDGRNPIKNIAYVVKTDTETTEEMNLNLTREIVGFGQTGVVNVELPAGKSDGNTTQQLYITKVNGDVNPEIDAAVSVMMSTLSRKLHTRVVVEEKTGTWCGFCTRGLVGLNLINEVYGDDVITIAVHKDDPMELSDYSYGGSFPSCYINKRDYATDPYYGDYYGVTPFGISENIDAALAQTVIGSVEVKAQWNDDTKTSIKMDTETTFATNINNAHYAIGYILLEDGLKGEGSSWAQANYYSGDNSADENLAVIASMPSMIIGMEYDHVPVAAWSPYYGVNNSIPRTIKTDEAYKYSYTGDISNNTHIQDKEKLSVVALLLDKNTSNILNAAKCKIEAYGTGIVNLNADSEKGDVYDLSGRKVKDNSDSMKNLPKGIYIINGKKVVIK